MLKFYCKVRTPQGQIVNLKMEEENKISCLKKLKRNGMTPISIKPSYLNGLNIKKSKTTASIYAKKKNKNILSIINKNIQIEKKVSIDELKEFTLDFYTLRKSNFSNQHALITIINKTENVYFKECLRDILSKIENGTYLHKAIENHNKIFTEVYINFIKTGELTASLDDALQQAMTYLDDEQKIKKQIKDTVMPNMLMFLGILLMLIIAIVLIIPNLQRMFISYNSAITLPKYITVISTIITWLLNNIYIIFLLIGLIIILFIKFVGSNKGRYKFDTFCFKNYFCGKLLFLLDFSRVIKSILLNLQNRMRLQDALEISKNVSKNAYMKNLIEKAINNFYVGKEWLNIFEEENNLNPIVLELLKKASNIRSIEIFGIGIKYLDKQIDIEIENVLKKMTEISYITVGVALLIFILTILIPCIQIYLGGVLFI